MTHTPVKLTFEQYLEYEDSTDNRYELLEGELIPMPPESGLNDRIARFLLVQFMNLVGLDRVVIHTLELQVQGNPPNRWADFVVLRPEHVSQLEQRQTLLLYMAPPLLVAELVSPYRNQNDENYRRDYVDKRQQYERRGIGEYWIIDPQAQLVTVLVLVNGSYQTTEFSENQRIVSRTFPELELTATQVLAARW
ncbi:MAG: Uma2 family endonuclease [Symploca sp. SIO2E6]|nr:Uma2 family endonuclease [Symploca sp. SIO2E6]